MNRYQRAQLRAIERFAAAEDPDLDRKLRGGLPSALRRRRLMWWVAGGAALFVLSILAAYPLGALLGMTMAAVAMYLGQRSEGGIANILTILQREPWPRGSGA